MLCFFCSFCFFCSPLCFFFLFFFLSIFKIFFLFQYFIVQKHQPNFGDLQENLQHFATLQERRFDFASQLRLSTLCKNTTISSQFLNCQERFFKEMVLVERKSSQVFARFHYIFFRLTLFCICFFFKFFFY